jgi:very-long-chain enoyl-CoA reductase
MNVYIVTKRGELELKLPIEATVQDLKSSYSKASKKSIHQLSFKLDDAVRLSDNSKPLKDYGVTEGSRIIFKDLGAQIGYRFVFVVEYLGPILFVLAYAAIRFYKPSLIYASSSQDNNMMNDIQKLGVICWCMHFLKREFETFFVHKFSRPTMPLSNLFKNCTYYWSFGVVIGYPLCSPNYKSPNEMMVHVGLVIFVLCELGNLICHIMLSNLRSADGSAKRPIPKGFLFNFVACPNYTFEVMSWVGFSIMTNITLSYVFTLVGFIQMSDWAIKKHKDYKKTYEKEYTSLNRKAIIPFVL